MNNTTFIIAEISANHCGDFEIAKRIIAESKNAGADAVKLQTYTPDSITINYDSDIFKIKYGLWAGKTMYQVYQEACTPWEWQGELKRYAEGLGVELFSTPFDRAGVDFLEAIGVKRYKIASFEAVDYPLIEYIAEKGKPIIMSVGISTKQEIHEALDIIQKSGVNDITLLKCVSEYPAKIVDMNLLTIPDMKREFGVKVGLSDHSMHIETCVAAVALGATTIEKHVTLDRSFGGADANFSLNICEFKATVKSIRDTEKALGIVSYTANEHARKGMRSLFAVKAIKKGELFTDDNVRAIRPGVGLHTRYWNELKGKVCTMDISAGTPLTKEMYSV